MSNKTKIIISIVIIAIVVAAVVFAKTKKEPEENVYVETQNITNTSVQNEVDENVVEENTTIENTVDTNTVAKNTNTEIQNSVVQDNIISSPDKNAYESQSNVGSTNSKQQAINLVKDYWGEDDTVTFYLEYLAAFFYINQNPLFVLHHVSQHPVFLTLLQLSKI